VAAPGHLAWFVIDAVGEMNLDAFYAGHRIDGRSRPPYHPAMMVALLLTPTRAGPVIVAGGADLAPSLEP